jgi:hypothetical protein
MKHLFTFLFILILVTGISFQAHAVLENRGMDINGNSLIYDSDLNITWYDYTKSADSWINQINWAADLTVDFGGNIYDDWLLPTTVDGPYVFGNDGTTTAGHNITSSEMGHLFYTELGNKGYVATNGTYPQPGWGLTNNGDFQTLQAGGYWSGTQYAINPGEETNYAWYFNTNAGDQGYSDKSHTLNYAIAVRPGDVTVVPEPISSILFLTGVATLIVRKYMRRK